MLKKDWLESEKQLTQNNKILSELYKLIEDSLKVTSSEFEIDEKKTVKSCYDEMEDYAEKHQENQCYCFTESETREFVKNYFEIKEQEVKTEFVNLSDFI